MSIKACVIGWPIEHSRSPAIHGYWLAAHGIDGGYTREAVEPKELETFLHAMADAGYAGCNVTVPHKERALALADDADEAARTIGAANTLWLEDGKLRASNTDAHGFLANLDETTPGWDANATCALVLGAGGAARAVLYALGARGFGHIILANRTRERAESLAQQFGGAVSVVDWETREAALENCALAVNTTTLGMSGFAPLEFSLERAGKDTVVSDLVYAPLETPLLAAARTQGLRAVDGLGMLLHQAVPGFEKWFGVRPLVTSELRARVMAELERA